MMGKAGKTAFFPAVLFMVFQLLQPTAPGAFAAEGKPSQQALPPVPPQADLKSAPSATEPLKPAMLTLGQCIEIALKKNPNVVASQYGVEVSRSRVGEARAGYYPQLSAQAGYTRINPVSLPTDTLNPSQSFGQYSASVTLNQNILD